MLNAIMILIAMGLILPYLMVNRRTAAVPIKITKVGLGRNRP